MSKLMSRNSLLSVRGVAILELAIITPFLLLLTVAIIELSRWLYYHNSAVTVAHHMGSAFREHCSGQLAATELISNVPDDGMFMYVDWLPNNRGEDSYNRMYYCQREIERALVTAQDLIPLENPFLNAQPPFVRVSGLRLFERRNVNNRALVLGWRLLGKDYKDPSTSGSTLLQRAGFFHTNWDESVKGFFVCTKPKAAYENGCGAPADAFGLENIDPRDDPFVVEVLIPFNSIFVALGYINLGGLGFDPTVLVDNFTPVRGFVYYVAIF
ncbi:MAG: pilus assembly protein [Deltaproteobacteria bacterium]|nr:pilus assembly protein [Deltaproteobacteria bacterium]